MLTTLPRRFDSAAAATIEVFLCRRTATVIAAIASVMKQASAMPRMSEPTRALPTMIATPQSATTLASMVRQSRDFAEARSRQARRRGTVPSR